VVGAVDLHHQAVGVPVEIEVVAVLPVSTQHLPVGLRKASPAQLPADVELTE
jgi:hypothetical protein